MSLKMHTETTVTYFLVEIVGAFLLEEAMSIFHECLQMALQQGLPRVLIDYRQMTGHVSILDRHNLGQSIGAQIRTHCPHFRFAFLGLASHILPDKFMENVVFNNGAVIKVTACRDEAIAWLERP